MNLPLTQSNLLAVLQLAENRGEGLAAWSLSAGDASVASCLDQRHDKQMCCYYKGMVGLGNMHK